MKTLITATVIALASTAAFAGPYIGVEYNSNEITSNGISLQVEGPRVYTGIKAESDDLTVYGEVGISDTTLSVLGFSASDEFVDWKIGADLEVADNMTLYGSYGNTNLNVADMAQTQIGIRWEF